MKKSLTFLISLLLFALPLCAFADGAEYQVKQSGNKPVSVTLWGTEEYAFEFNLKEDYQSVTSAFIPGEEYYDEGSEESYDTSVPGKKCFGIEAKNGGYYALLYDDPHGAVFKSLAKKADDDPIEGLFKDKADVLNENNLICGIIFKMEPGETGFAFIDEQGEGEYRVKCIYLGDKILSAKAAGPLLYSRYTDAYASVDYCDNTAFDVTEMYPHVELTFSEGRVLKISAFSRTKDLRTEGTVKANITVIDESFDIDVTYITADKLAKGLCMPKGFAPACTITYNGIIGNLQFPEYGLLTTPEGKEIRIQRGDSVILSNGRSYDFWAEYSTPEEGVLTDTVTFSYSLLGISENEINFTPACFPVKETLSAVISESKSDFKKAQKIISGEYCDYTKKEARFFALSFPRQIISAVKYYALFGKIPQAASVALFGLFPLLLPAAIIIALIVTARRKKFPKK